MEGTRLTLNIIESFGMDKKHYKPDHDDTGYEFTLPKTGIDLSTLFVCCGEPTESDSLEGLDGWIYIETKEELETIIKFNGEELFDYIESIHDDFDRSEYE